MNDNFGLLSVFFSNLKVSNQLIITCKFKFFLTMLNLCFY